VATLMDLNTASEGDVDAAADGTADPSPRAGLNRSTPLSLTILGATGSIGASTLDLVSQAPDDFDVIAVTANRNAEALARIAIEAGAKHAVVADPDQYEALSRALAGTGITAAAGEDAIVEAAAMQSDCVMAAIMGAAGLRASMAVLERGARLALANKECLVCAGPVFMSASERSSGVLLPVDSEHSAIFQALTGQCRESLEKVTVTASGGPFRTWSAAEIANARPEDALRHPSWSMGRKITIDSATLMNKGLELIEAHFLFDLPPEQLDVVVHPQSIIHSLVSYRDGSVLAQLGAPDMRTPIAYALAWPTRMDADIPRLDLAEIAKLTFERPDHDRFPALGLAMQVMRAGGTAPCVLNAANEVAVEAFLAGGLSFPAIAATVAETLDRADGAGLLRQADTLDTVLEVDSAARGLARDVIASLGT
jgi:1-deoxy-D-xylulose-5-phosphate reductoisomerase